MSERSSVTRRGCLKTLGTGAAAVGAGPFARVDVCARPGTGRPFLSVTAFYLVS